MRNRPSYFNSDMERISIKRRSSSKLKQMWKMRYQSFILVQACDEFHRISYVIHTFFDALQIVRILLQLCRHKSFYKNGKIVPWKYYISSLSQYTLTPLQWLRELNLTNFSTPHIWYLSKLLYLHFCFFLFSSALFYLITAQFFLAGICMLKEFRKKNISLSVSALLVKGT